MNPKFEVTFMKEVFEFFDNISDKEREKILFNIDKSRYENNPKLFKKLNGDIWEFRTLFNKKQYRLLAFWDKRDNENTLVVSTHGFVKKTSKVPNKEIQKADNLRIEYFKD